MWYKLILQWHWHMLSSLTIISLLPFTFKPHKVGVVAYCVFCHCSFACILLFCTIDIFQCHCYWLATRKLSLLSHSVYPSICPSVCLSATAWATHMYAALRVASHLDYRLVKLLRVRVNEPHYGSSSSVCVSVRPSVCPVRASNSKNRCRNTKIGENVS